MSALSEAWRNKMYARYHWSCALLLIFWLEQRYSTPWNRKPKNDVVKPYKVRTKVSAITFLSYNHFLIDYLQRLKTWLYENTISRWRILKWWKPLFWSRSRIKPANSGSLRVLSIMPPPSWPPSATVIRRPARSVANCSPCAMPL